MKKLHKSKDPAIHKNTFALKLFLIFNLKFIAHPSYCTNTVNT